MDVQNSSVALVARNYDATPIALQVRGNLGADHKGQRLIFNFTRGALRGFVSSVCGSGDPSVNHLFIADGSRGELEHRVSLDTDLDNDALHGIPPGSPMVYILYASKTGSCHTEKQHKELFEVVAAGLDALPTTCERCPHGRYTVPAPRSGCLACPPGHIGRDGFCARCPNGTRPDSSATVCDVCPRGWAGTRGFCSACADGTRVMDNRTRCESCGAVESGRGGACALCAGGSQPNPAHTGCVKCKAGFVALPTGNCTICADGFEPDALQILC